MKPELADREPIAYHELGHVYAHAFYGHKVESVEVGEDYGCTRLSAQEVNAFHLIVARCAGKAAVDKWYGWKSPDEENWRKSDDHREAYKLALEVSQNNYKAAGLLVQWAELVAGEIIEAKWPQIKEAADILVERGKLEVT